MSKFLSLLIILHLSLIAYSQNIAFSSIENDIINLGSVETNNEDFTGFSKLDSILKDVEIVMLGEQSHGDATTYETKIKLIKYLHQEMGFDLLAFEGGIYDCHKAWQLILEGTDARTSMAKSLSSVWGTVKEFIPLSNYIQDTKDSDSPLQYVGFDNQFYTKHSKEHFIKDLSDVIMMIDSEILNEKAWLHFVSNTELFFNFEIKSFKKNDIGKDLKFLNSLIATINEQDHIDDGDFWVQALKSLHAHYSDVAFDTYYRDVQMADNLIWLKAKYPNRKIICWGATSHFLYNSEEVRFRSQIVQLLGGNDYKEDDMMGTYIKDKFGDRVYTIGFTAYQGTSGLWRKRRVKTPKKGSLEALIGQSSYDNFLLPLNTQDYRDLSSRPLSYFYMKTPIDRVMDAVIFNRNMRFPKLDRNFYKTINPENKYIKSDAELEMEESN